MKSILQIIIALSFSLCNAQMTVSTVAGNGSNQTINGNGTSASFNAPNGIAKDSNGNLFVSEEIGRVIRKITPSGDVTIFAGSGMNGSVDGTGTAASFASLGGLVIDNANNVYVGDYGNSRIRKISPSGVVTTISSTIGNSSYAMCIDASKTNIYFTGSSRIVRKLEIATGIVTTIAGSGNQGNIDGVGTAAWFNLPFGLTLDPTNSFLYVSDYFNQNIRKINLTTTEVTTLAGNGSSGSIDGTGSSASFNRPIGMACSSNGDIFVADHFNNKIRKITPTGIVTTLAGTGAPGNIDGSVNTATFTQPVSLFLDNSSDLLFAEYGGNRIRKITNVVLNTENFYTNNLGFNLYPNPANNILNIEMDSLVKSIEVYSLQGQKVLSATEKQINVSNLANGIYMVRVEDESGAVATQKIIKN